MCAIFRNDEVAVIGENLKPICFGLGIESGNARGWQDFGIEQLFGGPIHDLCTVIGQANHSALLPCNGRTLRLQATADTPYLAICSLPGTFVHTCNNGPTIDVSGLPEGIYELKSLSRKGITHRLGFFIVKR